MMYYLVRRLNLLLSTLFILSIITFSLGHLFPGDPVQNFSGLREFDYEQYTILQEKYKLDGSYIQQYLAFISQVFNGDLGVSFNSQSPVIDELFKVAPSSIELSIYAMLLAILVGIPLGFWAGLRHQKLIDYSLYSLSVIGNSIPLFWLGLMFILLFSLNLNWLPMSGRINLLYEIPQSTGFILYDILKSDLPYKSQALYDALAHLILPTLTLAMVPITLLLTTTRNTVIKVMQTNYIKAAQTKGLSTWQLAKRHVFRNTMLQVIPQIALAFNVLMTSVMVTEVIFSWPGMGSWLIEAIYQRDYPVIKAGLLVVSAFIVFIHVCIDLLHAFTNPLYRKL
ncbi:peptide ABC transporter permease [Saccharobesus litoralis]|uniref:Peptide ABC transporter permease n=1 Tax=Saccharobesus litoralis TaxID=2172099 RepID=A0A2S0VSA2_9ALTE|nr:ABC transporter permease [Saccharobesus litoralis]AWB67096.1 peptide ABC transporter permease [Saccharobesus litoralis]